MASTIDYRPPAPSVGSRLCIACFDCNYKTFLICDSCYHLDMLRSVVAQGFKRVVVNSRGSVFVFNSGN